MEDDKNLKLKFENEFKECIARYTGNSTIAQSIKYALEGKGKRIRPLLCLSTTVALDGKPSDCLDAAIAVEMIHTYSLIHDDLPCMDNDDIRRGRPTLHKKFSEATAVLAGDGLLTDAFDIIASADNSLSADTKLAQVRMLSQAAGSMGMVMGQSMDMENTGLNMKDISIVDKIHRNKTGALIGASLGLGALAAKKNYDCALEFWKAGENIGLAYQIIDDLLDTATTTGKSVGKDQAAGKLTYLGLMSQQEALDRANHLTASALNLISSYTKSQQLNSLISQLLARKY